LEEMHLETIVVEMARGRERRGCTGASEDDLMI